MTTGRGGRTSSQRRSIAKKNPSRGAQAADKKIARMAKGKASSGGGKAAQANNRRRSDVTNSLNSRKRKHGF